MAEHRAVTEARAAHTRGDRVLQIGLTIAGGTIQDRRATIKAEPDDVNAVLNAVAAAGWDLVTALLDREPRNQLIMFGVYVWRRRG